MLFCLLIMCVLVNFWLILGTISVKTTQNSVICALLTIFSEQKSVLFCCFSCLYGLLLVFICLYTHLFVYFDANTCRTFTLFVLPILILFLVSLCILFMLFLSHLCRIFKAQFPRVPIMALTATATYRVQKDIMV